MFKRIATTHPLSADAMSTGSAPTHFKCYVPLECSTKVLKDYEIQGTQNTCVLPNGYARLALGDLQLKQKVK